MTWNKILSGFGILIAIILFSFGSGFWFGWQANYKWGEKCIEVIKHDTILVKESVKIVNSKPKKMGIPKHSQNIQRPKLDSASTTVECDKDTIISETSIFFDTYCDSTVFIQVTDSLRDNEIIGRQWNVQSTSKTIYETNTVEVAKKQPLLKVYLGVFGGSKFQSNGLNGASFGGDLTTVWNDRFMVRGSVDGLQRSANVGFGVKLSFKK